MPSIKVYPMLGLLACSLAASGLHAKAAKLKVEELVAKHLASLGTPESRAAAKNRIVSESVQMIPRLGGAGLLTGTGNILSEGHKVRFAFKFAALDYPGEQFAFDGEKCTVGHVRPGERSDLSQFTFTYDVILKEGLLGGALSTAWPLLDLADRQPKLDYTGLKKVEGKQYHEVKFRPRKGGEDLQISLYFEAESFRHVRTQYLLIQPANVPSAPGVVTGVRDSVTTLIERFDDFKDVNGLSLPHSYQLHLTVEGQSRTVITEWVVVATQLVHNQEIDPKYFVVQ
jgi:hypothetical protein